MTELLTARTVRALAEDLGLRPTKQRGQNFVIDPNTVRMIVGEAALAPHSSVLEVGPGLGSLTLGLLEAGHRVIAVEIDPLLAGRLPQTIAEHHSPEAAFDLVLGDALDVRELPAAPAALVANLPYNVAVPVILTLLARFDSLSRVLVMVQAEVADRLAAQPGTKLYGVPSLKAQWYGRVRRGADIGRNVFWPAPNVDSGLVHIDRHPGGARGDAAEREAVFALIDAAFAQRRKTLRAALAGVFGSPACAEEALVRAGLDPRARGETLTIDDFAALAGSRPAADAAGGQ